MATKEFDKNADCMTDLLIEAGVKGKDIAVGMSMMGKTIIVKLPNGGYVSIGKADAEKFNKAKASGDAAPAKPAASTRSSRAAKPTGTKTSRTSAAKPAKSSRPSRR